MIDKLLLMLNIAQKEESMSSHSLWIIALVVFVLPYSKSIIPISML